MSMLAGPRRKQKVINLRAKNNAWSNDNNKFGQRMLEKMGWSTGKGLGANENGIVEHVVARYKNDEKGLGFEDRNDQWTKHEDDFNALLANLSNASGNEDKLISGVSLEDKSKKSKARVHYHKFTRGKDLSRYSEKDLANILGKKSLKTEEKCEEPRKEDVKTTDQVFTEKGSMEDYFKNKLAGFKSKRSASSVVNSNNNDYDNADCGFQGFAGSTNNEDDEEVEHKGFGFQPFSFYPTVNDDGGKENGNAITKQEPINDVICRKSKKSKAIIQQSIESTQDNENGSIENKIKKKKSKSVSNSCSDSEIKDSISEEVRTKKSKKKKRLHYEIMQTDTLNEFVSKKKKSKNKSNEKEEMELNSAETQTDDSVPKKKKKRKDKEKTKL